MKDDNNKKRNKFLDKLIFYLNKLKAPDCDKDDLDDICFYDDFLDDAFLNTDRPCKDSSSKDNTFGLFDILILYISILPLSYIIPFILMILGKYPSVKIFLLFLSI